MHRWFCFVSGLFGGVAYNCCRTADGNYLKTPNYQTQRGCETEDKRHDWILLEIARRMKLQRFGRKGQKEHGSETLQRLDGDCDYNMCEIG